VRLGIDFSSQGRALLKVIAAHSDDQVVIREDTGVWGAPYRTELIGEDRVIVIDADVPAQTSLTYDAVVRVDRPPARPRVIPDAHYTHVMHNPWLIPSRYCPSDRLMPTAEAVFTDRMDPELLEHCRAWVQHTLTYAPGSSDAMTSADETLLSRRGICRDYAHLMISMLRALGIPARFAACFGPGVDPPDFHAVVEAHDGDRWLLLDPTGMTSPAELVVIARGRDAADVPWCQIQSGPAEVASPGVDVRRLDAPNA